jgi:hypothetical protein
MSSNDGFWLTLCIFHLIFGICDAKNRTFQLQSYSASAIKQRFKTQVIISDPDWFID